MCHTAHLALIPRCFNMKHVECALYRVIEGQSSSSLFSVLQYNEKSFIRNKMAQLFGLAFVQDYPLKVGE